MFNCIESSALMDVCRALGLPVMPVDANEAAIYIVREGVRDYGFKLSDYLLATAPVDVKEA